MPRSGKIEDPERLQKLAEARKKSLETRRKNAAKKKAALKEKEDKAAKYDKMVTKKKGKPKKEIEETQINLDDPIVARVANTARKNPKHDENVITHPSQSRFGEADGSFNDDSEPESTREETVKEFPEPAAEQQTHRPVKQPPSESEESESEPDLFKDEEEFYSDDTVESEEYTPPPRKPRKKKKARKKVRKVKYYSSSDSSDSDGEIIIRRKKPKKNIIYYEDLEAYLAQKENSRETFVEPPKEPAEPTPQQQEEDLFAQRLEAARKSLFTI